LIDHPVVSLEQLLDPAPSIDIVSREVTAAFGEVFGMQMVAELPASLKLAGS
jgi:hypothetical protein